MTNSDDSPRVCVDCDVNLVPDSAWREMTRAQRSSANRRGWRRHGGLNRCTVHYREYRRIKRVEENLEALKDLEYPAMRRDPLEDVPDELVHPQHLLVRRLLRESRAKHTEAVRASHEENTASLAAWIERRNQRLGG